MNARQVVFLLIAAIVAIAIALLVRAALVSTPPKTPAVAAQVTAHGVLVAARDIAPGEPISPDMVTWQVWPQGSIDASFITGDSSSSPAPVIAGAVARAPLARGEPLTLTKVVKSGASGFMAATLQPGMRAVAISVSVTTLAGGFVQPNDRVDILLTQNNNGRPRADLLMADIRVLAVDQSTGGVAQGLKAAPDARTVTLELSPEQVKIIAQAQATGSLSLALRPLVNSQGGTITIVRGNLGPAMAGGN
ncbi:MAG: Flp pilus assembly protein CpaB [Rhizomicrobium sp.]